MGKTIKIYADDGPCCGTCRFWRSVGYYSWLAHAPDTVGEAREWHTCGAVDPENLPYPLPEKTTAYVAAGTEGDLMTNNLHYCCMYSIKEPAK